MGMTMSQKILAAHAGLSEVKAGQLIEAKLDMVLGNDVTSPVAINVFEENGVEFAALHSLTPDDLRQKLDAGHPVLLPLQAWSSAEDGSYQLDDPSDPETYLAEGHWVICVGYGQRGEQAYFLFNDPACVGHDLIDADEFDRRWIDRDGAGTVYDHFGIEILQSTDYDPNGLFYME